MFKSLAIAILAATPLAAQIPERSLLTIQQPGLASFGFDAVWRGQDLELAEDAWISRLSFSKTSASPGVDEIRIMTSVPGQTTIASTVQIAVLVDRFEGTFPPNAYLRARTRYTIWFHIAAQPGPMPGANLALVDPTWRAYHTNVDPTAAPGAGEPGYYFGYAFGVNMDLVGYDNLDVGGLLIPGGAAFINLQANPGDLFALLFALGPLDFPLPPFEGPLRLDLSAYLGIAINGGIPATGNWSSVLPLPNHPGLSGVVIHAQALHDATFASGGRFSTMEAFAIQ